MTNETTITTLTNNNDDEITFINRTYRMLGTISNSKGEQWAATSLEIEDRINGLLAHGWKVQGVAKA